MVKKRKNGDDKNPNSVLNMGVKSAKKLWGIFSRNFAPEPEITNMAKNIGSSLK